MSWVNCLGKAYKTHKKYPERKKDLYQTHYFDYVREVVLFEYKGN